MSNITALAENIRTYRKKQGMSQQALAEKLNVSSQSVSSWETGNTFPDMTNFCRLTEIFNVSADSLLTKPYENGEYFMGIDGGGTKTEFVLCSTDGNIIYTCKLGPTNSGTIGIESACNTLRDGINNCIKTGVKISGAFLGIAGSNLSEIFSYISDRFPNIPIEIDSDAVNVLAGGNADIGIICGTGSIVLAREHGQNHFIGGWGYKLGDPCSGYNIGRQGVRASISMEEGIGSKTIIRDLLAEKLGLLPNEKISKKIYSVNYNWAPYIASFSSTVFAAAKVGDEIANKILDKEVASMMRQINAAVKQYDCGKRVSAAGGVIEHNAELILPLMKKYALSDIEFVISPLPPVYGAAVECANRFGFALSDFFLENFKTDYLKTI